MAKRELAHAESLKALEDEINYVVGDKAGQLDATITALKESESLLGSSATPTTSATSPTIRYGRALHR